MNDFLEVETMDNRSRVSRPTLSQVKALIDFMQKHPDLAHRKLRYGVSHQKFKKLWIELSNITNSIEGAMKSTKGWIKFWSDKRRSIIFKQKQIDEGKIQGKLSPLEQKILDLCESRTIAARKKRAVKEEPCNGDDDDDESLDDMFEKDDDDIDTQLSNENDDKQLGMMEKLVDVMEQQASGMSQMAQAHLSNSKSLERLAEASHIQALAVDRIASTFENISSSVHDVRNALLGIDYTMKRCYPASATQRQNSNIFS